MQALHAIFTAYVRRWFGSQFPNIPSIADCLRINEALPRPLTMVSEQQRTALGSPVASNGALAKNHLQTAQGEVLFGVGPGAKCATNIVPQIREIVDADGPT